MAKLNQITAVEKGIKSGTLRDLTDVHNSLQKPARLSGISRTYQPKDEEGEQSRSPRGCRSRPTRSSGAPPRS